MSIKIKNAVSLITLVLCLFTAGCSKLEEGGYLTPRATTSKYLRTSAANLRVNTRKPGFPTYYFLSLEVLDSLDQGAFLEVQFENPSDPKNPIIVTRDLLPKQRKIDIESPEVHGLEPYQGYIMLVHIYDNKAKANLLGTHRQVIQSITDQAKVEKMVAQNETKYIVPLQRSNR